MPTAKVFNLYGATPDIQYVDSGPVEGSTDYHTIFIFHGTSFNGENFKPLFPLAPKHNLRLVLYTRRDYTGSTPFSNQELEDLRNGKKIHLQSMGVEVGSFLSWFVENHPEIPKLSEDRKKGGISLLGWSMGITPVFAFLGHPEVLPSGTYTKLEPYLQTIIIYDSPGVAFGFDIPPGRYLPFHDPTLKTPSEMLQHFTLWVSGHYYHNIDDFESFNSTKNLDLLNFSRQGVNNSVLTMTEEMRSACIQLDVAVKSDIGATPYPVVQNILREHTDKALYNEQLAKGIFPKAEVIHILCDETIWLPVYAYMAAYEKYQKLIGEGKKIRPTSFVVFPGMNHFGHWDEPERFVELVVGALKAQV
ncbi:hypothetical protein AX16_009716 [Volvariella volvacea WC 439]|nr:hypothetical protein AX16_009716 [Volvariella volvacea WC 439]